MMAGAPSNDGFARVRRFLRFERSDLVTVGIYAAMLGLLTLVTPLAVQTLVNTVAFGNLLQPFVVMALMLLGALLFAAVLRALQSQVTEQVQQRLFVRFTVAMVERLLAAAGSDPYGVSRRAAASRVFDIFLVQKSIAHILLDSVGLVLQTGIGLVVLAFYHPYLLAFGVFLMAAIAVVLLVGTGGSETADDESKRKYKLAAWLSEIAQQPNTLRTPQGLQFATERAQDLASNYLKARRAHWDVLSRQILSALGLQVIASAGLLGLGGLLVVKQQLTLGQLIAAELIVSLVVDGVAKAGKHLESYYDLQASLGKLERVLAFPVEATGPRELPVGRDGMSVELQGVELPSGEELSLKVEPGARVLLLGETGSGKTHLLHSLYDGWRGRGRILLDGVDQKVLSRESVRAQMALVSDEEPLALSLADNLSLGDESRTVVELERVLGKVGLTSVLRRLPEGLETSLAPGGVRLSTGERRRLALARALLARPRLLVLDGFDGLEFSMIEDYEGTVIVAASHAPAGKFTTVMLPTAKETA